MNQPHTPPLSSIVDQLTARIEGLETTGNQPEIDALNRARNELLDYAFSETVRIRIIDKVLARIGKKGAARVAGRMG